MSATWFSLVSVVGNGHRVSAGGGFDLSQGVTQMFQ